MKVFSIQDDQTKKMGGTFSRRAFGQHVAWSALALTAVSTFGAKRGLSAKVTLDEGKAPGDGIELFY
ncbi:MAG: hypothetical protein ACR2QH_10175, partial [Geminicoccaceae bacterium]